MRFKLLIVGYILLMLAASGLLYFLSLTQEGADKLFYIAIFMAAQVPLGLFAINWTWSKEPSSKA